MRYSKTSFGTHVFYTRNWHYAFYRKRNFRLGKKMGVSVKRRVHPSLVQHYNLTFMTYNSREAGTGWIRHIEISKHRSNDFHGGRHERSKRYVRLKICAGPQKSEYATRARQKEEQRGKEAA